MAHKELKGLPGRFLFHAVKIGDRGQIVIPKDVREMFDIQPGETLALVANKEQGIGILKESLMQEFASMMMNGLNKLGEGPNRKDTNKK